MAIKMKEISHSMILPDFRAGIIIIFSLNQQTHNVISENN